MGQPLKALFVVPSYLLFIKAVFHYVVIPSLSCAQLFAPPWTVSHQAPLSVGFPRQEYWSEWPFPSQGVFLDRGSNLHLLHWLGICFTLDTVHGSMLFS